jgi:hypothetical protein
VQGSRVHLCYPIDDRLPGVLRWVDAARCAEIPPRQREPAAPQRARLFPTHACMHAAAICTITDDLASAKRVPELRRGGSRYLDMVEVRVNPALSRAGSKKLPQLKSVSSADTPTTAPKSNPKSNKVRHSDQ